MNSRQQYIAAIAIARHPLADRDPGLLGTGVRDMEVTHQCHLIGVIDASATTIRDAGQ